MRSCCSVEAGWQAQWDALSGFHTDEGPVYAAGNIVVVTHNSIGTHLNGNTMNSPHLDILEFEGDKIKKATLAGFKFRENRKGS